MDDRAVGVRARLAGQRVLLTGVTGFVGEALLERLLSDVPEAKIVVLVRARGGLSAHDRIVAPARQARVHRAAGAARPGSARFVDERVSVIEGDLAGMPDLPPDLDTVIHCAGEVSFDPPIDAGFATNLGGVQELLRAIRAGGSRPHIVHISTAYVAGLRSGWIPEGRVEHSVDWRAEQAAAVRAREQAEDASRAPDVLRKFRAEADAEHVRAGAETVARDAERRRRHWVDARLVDAGRERARVLGWTDCYTFTKALGERYLEQEAAGLPRSIVRPSIIESALARPHPGWIEGFKMAEPIILAYGRGELPDFPGSPDGVIDIIPVDLVVNAILAGRRAPAGAAGGARLLPRLLGQPEPAAVPRAVRARPRLLPGPPADQTRPGRRSRCRYGASPAAPPSTPDCGGASGPSAWPGARCRTCPRRSGCGSGPATWTGPPGSCRSCAATRSSTAPTRKPSSSTPTMRPGRCTTRSAPQDQALFGIDPTCFDWRYYLQDVHCPAVTAGLRALSALPRRPPRHAGHDLSPGDGVLAVFDMDGTLVSSTDRRVLPVAAPGRAVRAGPAARAGGGRPRPARAGCGPNAATGAGSSAPSTPATPGPIPRSWNGSSPTASATRCWPASAPLRCGGCASTARPATGRCC